MFQFFKKNSIQPKPRAAAADTILEVMVDGVAIADVNGNIIQSNTGFAKMFGFESADEVIGHLVTETIAEREIPRVMAEFEKSFKTGNAFNLEFIGKDRSGREFPVSINSTLLKDEKGNIVGNIGVLRDITELKKTYADIAELKRSEDALRKNEKKLTGIFENVNEVLYYIDVEADEKYRFQSVNPAFLQATGLKASQVVGKLVNEVIPEPSLSLVLSNYRKAIQSKELVRWEETTPYPAGQKVGDVTITPIFNEQGICTNLVGTVYDITERKQAEEKISQFANITKKNLSNLIPILQKVAMGDFSENIEIPKKEDEFTELLVALNLTIDDLKEATVELEEKVRIRTQDVENAKIAAQNVLEDLEIERGKLTEAKAKDEAILLSIGDGIIAVDKDRKIIVMNKAAEKLLGWEADEAVGKLYKEVVSLENEKGTFVPIEDRPLSKAFAHTTTTTTTTAGLYLLSKNKSKFPVAITVSPVILDNKTIGAVEVFRDITKEQDLNQAKDDFLNIAAHDLRTPMSGIRANTEMILGGDYGEIPPKFKIPLEDIDKANLNLIKMVNDFLTLGRIEKGKIIITPKPVDLIPILNTIVRTMRPMVEKPSLKFYQLKFDYEVPEKLPLVMADTDKIPEVIINFIDNAIKFTDRGSISLGVSVEKDSVVVKVADTGIGIAPKQQKNIFQKYTQIGAKERLAYGKGTGLGLGLYISRLITEGCGGKIWVESEVNKGSTFYFSLPIAK